MRDYLNPKSVTIGLSLVVFVVFWLWVSGYFSMWNNGIQHVADDPEETYHTTVPHEDEYTVELDLSNLDRNKDQLLYKGEEGHHIYVSEVLEHDHGRYEVVFRSKGSYGLDEAFLVSGVEYKFENQRFGTELRAEGYVDYQGKAYKLQPSTHSNLIYKDGDEFGFYLTLPKGDLELDLNKEPIIEVTVSGLIANIWVNKERFK